MADRPGFNSPSGNIICYLENDLDVYQPVQDLSLTCLVFEATWTLPDDYGDDDPICDLDRTRRIVSPPDGPAIERWTCHGDVFWPIHGAISYGAEWSFLSFDCQMADTGVSCQNGQGHEFSVRRSAQALY
ncbi:hypothetical protein A8B78_05675 [Jannaschia sp. EhC01]|nr:hypothetical protein A8B78_05675 [Jannaschia sp. EhC01]